MLDYNEIKKIVINKEMTISTFCEKLKFTRQGLQKSLDNGLLPVNKLLELCQLLDLTPNQFMEWEKTEPVPYMAAESRQYTSPQVPQSATVEALVEHIAWMQSEIDRLRAAQQKGKRSA